MSDATDAATRRELLRLADALLVEAESIQRQWTALARALSVTPGGATPDPRGNHDLEAPASTAEVMAVAMARGGRSRVETESYLREAFDLDIDPALLERLFPAS